MNQRIAYFDCFSGISGNMTLGAMLACGLEEEALRTGLEHLGLPGWSLVVERVTKGGISAIHVRVEDTHHTHRGLQDILGLIAASGLLARVQERASAIFTRLGEAEARVHGTTPAEVHFHEVGAVDAIVDIVGTAIGLEALGIERVVCSPLPLGSGWVTCAHGEFPVPAPAVAELVKGFPTVESDIAAELVTPTGAAIATTLAERFGPLPGMTVRAVGYGAGTRDLPRPNVLRLFIGEAEEGQAPTEVIGLECNLDDVSGEVLGYVMERLFAAGALDVFYTAIQMKKNRPGVLVRALCAPTDEAACTAVLFTETPTLGVRRLPMGRVTLPRASRTVETPYGPVRVKESQWGDATRAVPEYEDCRALAEQCGVPLQAVMEAARRAAEG